MSYVVDILQIGFCKYFIGKAYIYIILCVWLSLCCVRVCVCVCVCVCTMLCGGMHEEI